MQWFILIGMKIRIAKKVLFTNKKKLDGNAYDKALIFPTISNDLIAHKNSGTYEDYPLFISLRERDEALNNKKDKRAN